MKYAVNITIRGIHTSSDCTSRKNDNADKVETETKGVYAIINNKEYISYNKEDDNCVIKMESDSVLLSKKGSIRSNMLFKQGQKSISDYITPYGSLRMDIETHSIIRKDLEDGFIVSIEYTINNENERIADSRVEIEVKKMT